jgi:SAM-dependent methyltransferase
VSNTVVPPSSAPYYTGRFWNELPAVVRHLQRRATDDPIDDWIVHLHHWRGAPFRKALVLNCGNGWVERAMVERGVVHEAVGVDVSDALLGEARAAAKGLPIRHYCVDTNEGRFPEDAYDLVVNHAALHHVAYIDRVMRVIAALLASDGVLVSWDYVGPHRNQYPGGMWEAAHQVNVRLPDDLRSAMHYPKFSEMIEQDPTEAVHSELTLAVMRRYFDLVHERALGGGIAYPLLTHNAALLDAPRQRRDPLVDDILAADTAFTDAGPGNVLFTYVIAVPHDPSRHDGAQLAAWTAEEFAREEAAAANGGRYYPPTVIEDTIARFTQPGTGLPTPGVAYRQAAAATARAVSRHLPPSWRSELRRLPGVETGWRKLLGLPFKR